MYKMASNKCPLTKWSSSAERIGLDLVRNQFGAKYFIAALALHAQVGVKRSFHA
jgi:hypothetical protein